jgi:hypothetical protein
MYLPETANEALQRDIGIYDDGEACPRCNRTIKYANNQVCVTCYERSETFEQRQRRRERNEFEARLRKSAPRSRIEAEEIDHPYYRVTTNCPRCGDCLLRYTDTGGCLQCHFIKLVSARQASDRLADQEAKKSPAQKKLEAEIREASERAEKERKRELARERKKRSREKNKLKEQTRARVARHRAKQRAERKQSTDSERKGEKQ